MSGLSRPSASPPLAASARVLTGLVCLAAFAFYLWLIRAFPTLYWYDPYVRLAYGDRILLGHWLPLTQSLVYLAGQLGGTLSVTRSLFALAAVVALAGSYRLAAQLFSPIAGLVTALWLAPNLMFAALATVPYPEVLFAALTVLALTALGAAPWSRRWYLGVLFVNLACFTRYEGWLLAGVLAAEWVIRSLHARRWRQAAWAALLFGWAPLLWLVSGVPLGEPYNLLARLRAVVSFETGFTESPLAQIAAHLSGRAVLDFLVQFAALLRWQLRPEIRWLALSGLIMALVTRSRSASFWRCIIFVSAYLVFIAVLPGYEPTNLRQTFVFQLFATLAAAFGWQRGVEWLLARLPLVRRAAWVAVSLAAVLALVLARSAVTFVAGAANESEFAVPARAGAWLRAHPSEATAVLALSAEASSAYALAVYSGLPLNRILDEHRFTPVEIARQIAAGRWVYVVVLPSEADALPPYSAAVLKDLEAGRLGGRVFDLGPAQVWLCRSADWPEGEYVDD